MTAKRLLLGESPCLHADCITSDGDVFPRIRDGFTLNRPWTSVNSSVRS